MRGRRDQPNDDENPPGPEPWQQGDGGSFGSWLRQQREIRNISLREISDNTKIGMRYLEALEEDRFEILPAPIFAKGFLREYAKYVGLDADEVVNFYIAADQRRRLDLDETAPVTQRPPLRAARRAPPVVPLLVGGVLLLVLLVLAVWLLGRGEAGASREQAPPPAIAAPVVEPPPPPAPLPAVPAEEAAAGALLVNLTFTAECWVEALIDGERRIEELHVAGESMRLPARESVLLETLGNAGAVRVEVNGRPLQLGSAPGQVVRDLLIDRATAGLPPLPAAVPTTGGGRRP
jgi:cytoskeletal protein RodZ